MLKNLLFTVALGAVAAHADCLPVTIPPTGRQPAFAMRFDDNRDPLVWKAVCKSFRSRGLVCSLAVNCTYLNADQRVCLKELSDQGHEIMDHTPTHALYAMDLPDSATFAQARKLPFVSDVEDRKRRLYFRPLVDPAHPKNVRRRLTVVENVVETIDGRPWKSYANLLLPGRHEIVALSVRDGRCELVDFWRRPLAEEITLTDVEVTMLDNLAICPDSDQLRLMARTATEAFRQAGLPQPNTWICPGGWYPSIDWKLIKRIYGDEFGYVCGDARPGAPRPGILSVADEETTAGKWSMCCDGYFFDKDPKITPEMVADHIQERLRAGRSLVILSHLWSVKLPGGQREMLEKIDRFAEILAERKVPMCTHSELAVKTFGR